MNRNFYRRICCGGLQAILLLLTVFFSVPVWGDNGVPAFGITGQDRSRDESKPNVVVEIVSSVDAAVGRRFDLEVVLNVSGGGHLYANPKQGELGIDTEIVPEPIDGVKFGEVIYPAGEKYDDEFVLQLFRVLQLQTHFQIHLQSMFLKNLKGGIPQKKFGNLRLQLLAQSLLLE